MNKTIAALRKDYRTQELRESDVAADPIDQFREWFAQALAAEALEPNGMTLATVNREGHPSARIVLLKGVDENGFVFFTNYESRKGQDLEENPHAALVFWWPELERQVRIEGVVEKVGQEESDEYFNSRPVGSRLGTWASRQSRVIESRSEIEQRVLLLGEQYPMGRVPRPPYWGGYRLRPVSIEFWQGRPNRLHDRLRYVAEQGGGWHIERLSP